MKNVPANQKKQDVVFRRVRGRIIAIKRSPSPKNEAAKNVGIIAGGVAIAAGAGELAARVVKEASAIRFNADTKFGVLYRATKRAKSAQGSFAFMGRGYGPGFRKAAQARLFSQKLFKLRNPLLTGGALLGSAVIGAGINRMNKKATLSEDIAGGAVGTLAAGAAISLYYRRLGVKNIVDLAKYTSARMRGTPYPGKINVAFNSARHVIKKGVLRF